MSEKRLEEELEIRRSIKHNLQTMRDAIHDFGKTADSIDYNNQTNLLRENLLKLAIKYVVLTNGVGNNELRKEIKQRDPGFASELQTLVGKKGDARYAELKDLATEIASESILAMDAIRSYKLPESKLDKRFDEAYKLFVAATNATAKPSITPHEKITAPRRAGVFGSSNRKTEKSEINPSEPTINAPGKK